MKFLTKADEARLPKLYSQEDEPDPLVQVKFFSPWGSWSWYAIEYDGEDLFFGWVDGDFPELGYFSREELEAVRGPFGLKIERDRFFRPTRLSEVKEAVRS